MTYTCAVFHGADQSLTFESGLIPELQDGETLIEIICCSLCRSDIHTFAGNRIEPTPLILGHEIIGKVLDTRAQLPAGVAVGTRVTWGIAAYCGKCFFCQRGLTQKCKSLYKYGHAERTEFCPLGGGLATHIILKDHTPIFAVPDSLSDSVASLANCSVATAAAAMRVSGAVSGDVVLVIGAGILGVSMIAMSRKLGCPCVVFDPSEEARSRSLQFGADAAFGTWAELQSALEVKTDGRGADVVFELAGTLEACQRSLDFARIGGTVVWAGAASPVGAVQTAPEQVVRRLLSLKGIHNYVAEDLATALAFLEMHAGEYPFADLFGETFVLSDVNAALDLAHQVGGQRIVVTPN